NLNNNGPLPGENPTDDPFGNNFNNFLASNDQLGAAGGQIVPGAGNGSSVTGNHFVPGVQSPPLTAGGGHGHTGAILGGVLGGVLGGTALALAAGELMAHHNAQPMAVGPDGAGGDPDQDQILGMNPDGDTHNITFDGDDYVNYGNLAANPNLAVPGG